MEQIMKEKEREITMELPPPQIELVPIGEYDGGELLPGCYILDDSYIVYMEVDNSELQ